MVRAYIHRGKRKYSKGMSELVFMPCFFRGRELLTRQLATHGKDIAVITPAVLMAVLQGGNVSLFLFNCFLLENSHVKKSKNIIKPVS